MLGESAHAAREVRSLCADDDRNDPGDYAQFVAKEMGVSAETRIDKLVDA